MRSEGKAKAGASAGCREAVEFYRSKSIERMGIGLATTSPKNGSNGRCSIRFLGLSQGGFQNSGFKRRVGRPVVLIPDSLFSKSVSSKDYSSILPF